jgi:hypothetical protein
VVSVESPCAEVEAGLTGSPGNGVAAGMPLTDEDYFGLFLFRDQGDAKWRGGLRERGKCEVDAWK